MWTGLNRWRKEKEERRNYLQGWKERVQDNSEAMDVVWFRHSGSEEKTGSRELVLAAGDAGADIIPDVLQGGPPKLLPEHRACLSDPGMTGEPWLVAPLQQLSPQVRWDEQ